MRAATSCPSLFVVPLLLSCCLTLALLPLTAAASHPHDPRGPYSYRRLLLARPPYPQRRFLYPSEVQIDHGDEAKVERGAEERYLDNKILQFLQRYLHPSSFPSIHYNDQPLLQAPPSSSSHASSNTYIKRSGQENPTYRANLGGGKHPLDCQPYELAAALLDRSRDTALKRLSHILQPNLRRGPFGSAQV